MGPRNLLILFFSTVAVSLVILVIFFSLFFKNLDLNFNTKLPQSAPDVGGLYTKGGGMNPESKAGGLLRSTVNVPPEIREAEGSVSSGNAASSKKAVTEPADSDLPPVSDDAMLNENPPALPSQSEAGQPPTPHPHGESRLAPPPPTPSRSNMAPPPPRHMARPLPPPTDALPPADDMHSGPPVPGQ